MGKFLIENWQIIIGAIGTGGAWFGAQKLQKINAKTTELENLKTVREMEKGLIADMETQIEKLKTNNNVLQGIVNEQNKLINKYTRKYGEL